MDTTRSPNEARRMGTHHAADDEARAHAARPARADARERLLADLDVEERRLVLAGISTAVLQGGDGHPIVLLHGPGEFAAKWWRVIPELVERHRVVAPDLPAHAGSQTPAEPLDEARVLAWLAELIDRTCPSPPTLVGHVLGGAIAARFAVEHADRLERLVLVDTLGLARFRPRPRFAATLIGLQLRPTELAYNRFMNHCSADLLKLRRDMGDRWEPYMSYSLDLARSPSAKAMRRLMRDIGLPPISPDRLARIGVPTTLIWGRQDKANSVRIAQAASARHRWPLHVIEDCADDPARDHPEAFLRALRAAMATDAATAATT
jgi:pimeloyl-ACP methyl ester carboxylesterase